MPANKIFNKSWIAAIVITAVISSCNKEPEEFTEPALQASSGLTLGDSLKNIPGDSLYYRLLIRAGMTSLLNSRSNNYSIFVPGNNAMKVFINAISGGAVPLGAPDAVFSGFISANLPVASAVAIASYSIIPQAVSTNSFASEFPNIQYPTIFNPAPSISSLLRMTTFLGYNSNGVFVNNIPVVNGDIATANGYIHEVPAIVLPPTRYLWDRISGDADLTIFKAAIERADSGAAAASSLQAALMNIGANFTVLAPTNQAMKNAISFLTGGVIPAGAPDAVFIGFIGSSSITTRQVLGIVAYHMFDDRSITTDPEISAERPGGFFTVNIPTTSILVNTLLSSGNSSTLTMPGVSLQAAFAGPVVTAAIVQGALNPTPSNFLIDPTPEPNGTSDQHYLNGTLHKIDQVLIPLL